MILMLQNWIDIYVTANQPDKYETSLTYILITLW